MLARYTYMIEGVHTRAAGIMRVCFDEAIDAEVQDAHRLAQMTGGNIEFDTL
jgi:hypothetical protein